MAGGRVCERWLGAPVNVHRQGLGGRWGCGAGPFDILVLSLVLVLGAAVEMGADVVGVIQVQVLDAGIEM